MSNATRCNASRCVVSYICIYCGAVAMTAQEDPESEVVSLLASPVTRVGMDTGSVAIDGVIVARLCLWSLASRFGADQRSVPGCVR